MLSFYFIRLKTLFKLAFTGNISDVHPVRESYTIIDTNQNRIVITRASAEEKNEILKWYIPKRNPDAVLVVLKIHTSVEYVSRVKRS